MDGPHSNLPEKEVCDIVHGTLLKVQKIYRGKATSYAKSKMEEADHWLKKDKLDRALTSANLAVIRAPTTSKDMKLSSEDASILPMSLFIRSELLYKMSEYQACLNDIQLGLKHHLSEKHKAAAYLRMGMCYLKLGEKNKSKVALTVASTCGDEEIKLDCQNILKNIDNFLEVAPVKHCPNKLTESLDDLPGISKSLVLVSEEGRGRYFKTSTPIFIGDIVACEEPYVSTLGFEKNNSHCLHCYRRLKSPIPCPDCSGVGFCSVNCLNNGMIYHKWECHYLELAIGSGMSMLCLLSLRIITQESLEYFITTNKKSDYIKVLNLVGHTDKRDIKDLLSRTLMALFLLQLLRHSGYFSNQVNKVMNVNSSFDEGIVLSQDELKIGTLLLKHLLVLQYNAHEIYETAIAKTNVNSQGHTHYIALGLYLSSSLFNHECQPTLGRYFSGKKIVLRAQHSIDANQPVSENYGPVFTMKGRDERLKMLKGRYLFDCDCIACKQDWPKLVEMVPETAYYRCKTNSCSGVLLDIGLCDVCGNSYSLEESKLLFHSYQEDWDRAVQFMLQGKFNDAELVVTKYIEVMYKLVVQPSKNLCLAMEALRTIWANTAGNTSIL